jgi:hypothetical protein
MTSTRASRARFGNYREISTNPGYGLDGHRAQGQHTGRTRGPCSRPSASSLPRHQSTAFCMSCSENIQGSSSSRFSKNRLPYLSMPIKVPALVSPVSCQPPVYVSADFSGRTDVLRVEAPCVSRVCEPWWARECERTCIWRPYSCHAVSVCFENPIEAARGTHLEANLAQVAQCPHKRRHGGVVCSKSSCRRMLLLD